MKRSEKLLALLSRKWGTLHWGIRLGIAVVFGGFFLAAVLL